jgi:hypothetical protein
MMIYVCLWDYFFPCNGYFQSGKWCLYKHQEFSWIISLISTPLSFISGILIIWKLSILDWYTHFHLFFLLFSISVLLCDISSKLFSSKCIFYNILYTLNY